MSLPCGCQPEAFHRNGYDGAYLCQTGASLLSEADAALMVQVNLQRMDAPVDRKAIFAAWERLMAHLREHGYVELK